MISLISVLLLIFILTSLMVYFVRVYSLKNLLDHPNHRSSHSVPTPRGGGAASVLVFLLANAYFFLEQRIGLSMLTLSGIGTGIAALGFWDDHKQISSKLRLSLHFLAAIIAMFSMQGFPVLEFFNQSWFLGWFGYAFGALFLVWMINLFNFMDGIDGIAASEVSFVSILLALFIWPSDPDLALLGLGLGAVCLGFLLWNWPPAKIFMGDVGSGFMGFMLGTLVLKFTDSNPLMFPIGLILMAYFVVDATFTLVMRFATGQKWYEAHCLHGYQKLAKQWGHVSVLKSVWLVNLCFLMPLAYLTYIFPHYAPVFLVSAYLPLIAIVNFLGAGKCVAN